MSHIDLGRPADAILAPNRNGQAWLAGLGRALELAGARTVVVPAAGAQGHALARTCDALVLAGDAAAVDALRMQEGARHLARAMDAQGKPIGVIGHGAWLLVSAGLAAGRELASWPSLQDDIRNAGGTWVDREVVVDANWVSSRGPEDLWVFSRELLAAIARAAGPVPA